MSRPIRLAFACLACFLVLLPLSLKKPGLPMRLAGDEATYFAMAASLAAEGDLSCERADLERLFAEFPFDETRLSLTSEDGWSSVAFARPVIYPLLAAPWVALWGANGPIALNAVLFLIALACGWRHLRHLGPDGMALLFGLAFFLFSAAFFYLFRIEPQVLTMAAVAVALTLGWRQPRDQPGRHRRWLSGAALGVAVLQEPALVALAVPILSDRSFRTRPRGALSWLAALAATVALGVLLSVALTGKAWPDHLGSSQATTFVLDNPLEIPWHDPSKIPPTTSEPSSQRSFAGLLEDASFQIWGRRTGVLPYFPLILPILLLFGTGSRRSSRQWLLLATVTALGILQLIVEPPALAAHPLQVGNPYMVGLYPAFLFLIPRLGQAVVVGAYGLGALATGALISTTLGVVVPEADIHAHTRNFPLRLLPFEYPALGRASGYRHLELHGLDEPHSAGASTARLWAPADQVEIRGDELWLLGGESIELWLESRAPIPSAVFQLRNLASGNRVSMRLAGDTQARDFEQVDAGGVSFQLEFTPDRPDKVRRDADDATHYYRLKMATRVGEKPAWRQGASADDYLGVALAFLGTREILDRDLYAAEWSACGVPPRVAPGERFLAATRLRNLSRHRWPDRGPARVRLSYRWLDASGQEVPHASRRTELAEPVEPDQEIASWVSVDAPRAPGNYLLELDPVFENVAWFSSRIPESTCRVEIAVE